MNEKRATFTILCLNQKEGPDLRSDTHYHHPVGGLVFRNCDICPVSSQVYSDKEFVNTSHFFIRVSLQKKEIVQKEEIVQAKVDLKEEIVQGIVSTGKNTRFFNCQGLVLESDMPL